MCIKHDILIRKHISMATLFHCINSAQLTMLLMIRILKNQIWLPLLALDLATILGKHKGKHGNHTNHAIDSNKD